MKRLSNKFSRPLFCDIKNKAFDLICSKGLLLPIYPYEQIVIQTKENTQNEKK